MVTKKKTTKKTAKAKLDVVNTSGKVVGEYAPDSFVFDGEVNEALIHQAVTTYLANQRKGLASTKTRGKVSGGGAKPWRQKGTGRARAGSNRSPIWRGGGTTFGPQPHSYRKELPKKMKALAFKSALNAKHNDHQIVVLDEMKLTSHKTKDFIKILQGLKVENKKVRFVVEAMDVKVKRASGNIAKVSLAKAANLHATEVIDCKNLILTQEALRNIEARIKGCLQ